MPRASHLIVGVLFVVGTLSAQTVNAASQTRGDCQVDATAEATLFADKPNEYVAESTYRARTGEDRSLLEQFANATDLTFATPPDTAAAWTCQAMESMSAGGPSASIAPTGADREDGRYIRDAHASIVSIHPSTRAHVAPEEPSTYVAPEGYLRGFIDYRVFVPESKRNGNRTTRYSIDEHEIERVRLLADGEIVATQEGSHSPEIAYDLTQSWQTTLTLEADVHVAIRRTQRIERANRTRTRRSTYTETRTVSDSIDVDVYDPITIVYRATYPDGDDGIAIVQSRPWQGLSIDSETGVRGIWRFYTARDPAWAGWTKTTADETTPLGESPAPVWVHAFPSRSGPRVQPVDAGPALLDVWGERRSSPVETLGEHVEVDVVEEPYTTTDGLALRADDIDRDEVTVSGIVRGADATGWEPRQERRIRESRLTAAVVDQNLTHATVRLELRDDETGAPIVLDDTRRDPIGETARSGSITIADQHVDTNPSGVATVTLGSPGIYTARYEPGSWLSHDPAYTGATATVRWHPLRSVSNWPALVVQLVWLALPVALVYYVGRRLLAMGGYLPAQRGWP